MAPEGHGAQVLLDPDLGPKKVTPPKSEVPCNFCFLKFLPKRTVEAPEAPRIPFTHPVPEGGGGTGSKNPPPPQEPSPPQGPPLCQIPVLIHPAVWIENKQTDRQILPFIY